MDWFDDSALTLAVFLPLLGAVAVAVLPKERDGLIRGAALSFTALALLAGVGMLARFDYRAGAAMQFEVARSWIPSIGAGYHVGVDGIALPLLVLSLLLSLLCVVYSWKILPEPGNPKAFLALMLLLETGMNGTFVALDLVLFFVFWEIGADPHVLHDRRLGRGQARLRLDQVHPLHPDRVGGHAAGLPGPVAALQRRGGRPHLRHPGPAGAGRGPLRRHLRHDRVRRRGPRLRRQGADVAVPHLAARRPHRGPDGRLGAAGRDPAEDGHLRVRPHRPADPARGRPDLGPGHRRARRPSPSSTAPCAAWPSGTSSG